MVEHDENSKRLIDDGNLENLRPHLLSSVTFIHFSETTVFLRNTANGALCKCSVEEAAIARMFDGTKSVADIVFQRLASRQHVHFAMIVELLAKLRKSGCLASKSASTSEPRTRRPEKYSMAVRSANRLARCTTTEILSVKHPSASHQTMATALRALFSWPVVVGLGCCAAACIGWYIVLYKDRFVSPAATAHELLGSLSVVRYGGLMLLLWFWLSVLISLRNVLSLFMGKALGCEPGRIALQSSVGLVYFHATISSCVEKGKEAVVRLFIVRGLFVILVFALISLVGISLPYTALVDSLRIASAILLFVSYCPFLPGDLTTALFLLTRYDARPVKHLQFLATRFFPMLLNPRTSSHSADYALVVSAAGIVWVLLFYSWVWSKVATILPVVFSELIDASATLVVLGLSFTTLLFVPLVCILVFGALFLLKAVSGMARTPYGYLKRLGRTVSHAKRINARQTVPFLRSIPLFASLTDEALTVLCERLILVRKPARRCIVVQHEPGDSFFIVAQGELAVQVEDETGTEKTVATLTAGDSFGETALLEDAPRTATVVSTTPVVLLELPRADFTAWIEHSLQNSEDITDLIRVGKLIMEQPAFSSLGAHQIHQCIRLLKKQTVEPGACIIEQDTPGDRFYIVAEGSVSVRRERKGAVLFQKQLSRGDFFGEIALLKDTERTAGVRAQEKTRLLYLEKKDFIELMGRSFRTGMRLDAVADDRLRELGMEAAAPCS